MTLIAFHGDAAVKEKYIARINAHIAADSLTHAVGCTLDDFKYDCHGRYPAELGIPEWLAHVEGALFERISAEKSRTWPLDFLLAIAPGTNLDRLRGPFIIMVLKGALETFDHVQFPEVKSVVDRVIALWQREDAGSPEFRVAADAIHDEALVAGGADIPSVAVWACAAAADAATAIWGHDLTPWAAALWVWPDASDAEEAAKDWAERVGTAEPAGVTWGVKPAKYDYYADELLRLLAGAPMAPFNANKDEA